MEKSANTYLIRYKKKEGTGKIVGSFIFTKARNYLKDAQKYIRIDKRYAFRLGMRRVS